LDIEVTRSAESAASPASDRHTSVLNDAEREFLARRLARAETERRRLLDAYYGGAVDLPTLRTEQERIGREVRAVEGQMEAANAHLEEWQEVLRLAARIAGTCAAAYARASDKTRRLFNNAVFEAVLVRDGKAAEAQFREPFDVLFSSRRFEYGDLAVKALRYSNYQTTRTRLIELAGFLISVR
jgi:hypothetical protein